MDTNTVQLNEIKEELAQLRQGFPDDDPAGHRRYHIALIKAADERRKFWSDWRAHLVKYGSVAALGFLGYQLLEFLKYVAGKFPKG